MTPRGLFLNYAFAGAATIVALSVSAGQHAPGSVEKIEAAAWIAGCWARRSGQTVVEEQWMVPRGGMMLGMSRTVRDGKLVEYEFIRLFESEGRLVYLAMPSRQAPAEFKSTATSDSLLIFENPAHDFPQRIIYRKQGADSLTARIEGPGPAGPRGVDFRYARAVCPGERASP
jgi:hypothetical protein